MEMKKIITFLVLVFCVANSFGQDILEQINKDFADKTVIQLYNNAKILDETDIPANLKKSNTMYKEAAIKGYAPAQFDYGRQCLVGVGHSYSGYLIDPKEKEGIEMLEKAGQQNFDLPYELLGRYYLNFVAPYDINKSIFFFTKAAELGNTDAMFSLGALYFEGDKIEKNFDKALYWLTKNKEVEKKIDTYIAEKVDRQLFESLRYEKLKSVATTENLSPKEAYDLAIKFNDLYDYTNGLIWMQKAAKDGYILAEATLGNMYYQGQGTSVNYKLAFDYWTKASDKEEPNARLNLGYFCYFLGNGTTVNVQKANDLLSTINDKSLTETAIYKDKLKPINEALNFQKTQTKANQGNALAQEELGNNYVNGYGTEINEAKAVEYYTKSAAQGNSNAEIQLADLYLTGTTTPFNDTKAFALLQKNSNLKSNQRDYLMGFCSYHGYGTSKDLSKALEYFNKSNDNRKNLYYAYYYYFGYAGVAQSYENAKSSLDKIKLDNEGQKFYDNILGQLKYDKSLIMDTCPVCQGTGITYSKESYTYTTQEKTGKRETVLVYDSSSNFTTVQNVDKTFAQNNIGQRDVQHTCSRCNGSGKVHRY